MNKYDWRRDTLGRHCMTGGCGEQLDLWNEGATSEFSQFGSGITNYFKVCFILKGDVFNIIHKLWMHDWSCLMNTIYLHFSSSNGARG